MASAPRFRWGKFRLPYNGKSSDGPGKGKGGSLQAGDENTTGPKPGGPERLAEDQSPGAVVASAVALTTSTANDATSELVTGLDLLRLAAAADDLPAGFLSISPEDPRFIDLWDKDQLLFPDALARLDEMLQQPDQMPLPDVAPGLQSPIPTVVRLRADGAGVAGEGSEAGQSPVAALAPVAGAGWEMPDLLWAARTAVPLAAVPSAGQRQPSRPPPTARGAVSGVQAVVARVGAAILGRKGAADPLRPYKIALGLVPALAVFGYTPATLRDHIETARRAWRQFRDGRRAGR
jgi:hypothetical protein